MLDIILLIVIIIAFCFFVANEMNNDMVDKTEDRWHDGDDHNNFLP